MPAYLDLMPDEELRVTPRWLRYDNDYSVPQKVIVSLENTSSRPVAYRLRAKHPEYFRSRFARGVIGAHSHTFVEIYLMEIYQWSEQERNQHKLLIESLYLPHGNEDTREWSDCGRVSSLFDAVPLPVGAGAGAAVRPQSWCSAKAMPCYFKIPVVLPRPFGDENATGPSSEQAQQQHTSTLIQYTGAQLPHYDSQAPADSDATPRADDIFFASTERTHTMAQAEHADTGTEAADTKTNTANTH